MPGHNIGLSTGTDIGVTTTSSNAAAGAGTGTTATASGIPLSAYLGAGLGLIQALGTMNQNSQIKSTDDIEELYKAFGNQEYIGDFANLIQQRKNSYLEDVPSWKDIRLMNGSQQASSAISSGVSGAMAGAGFGPLGMGIGALVGSGLSLLGNWIGGKKAKTKEAELQELRNTALEENQRNFLAGVKNAQQQLNFQALSNIAAFGGPLQSNGGNWSNGLITIDAGGTHESNPYGGVPMGLDSQGVPNLLEEDEVVWKDYVFSNRLKVPKAIRKKYKLKGIEDMTFADAVKYAQKESEERPNDPISIRGLDSLLSNLAMEQEEIRMKNNKPKTNRFDEGGPKVLDTRLRYMPAFGLGVAATTDALGITNTPNTDNADALLRLGTAAKNTQGIAYTPSGTYINPRPFDTLFNSNILAANANATRRAIRNNSSGNRMTAIAGLLAADFNAQQQHGALLRQAQEYNQEQKMKSTEFNNAIDRANAEGFLKAAMANQEARSKANALGLEAQMAAYQMREKARIAADDAKSSNMSGFLTSLGNIGKENHYINQLLFRNMTGTDGNIDNALLKFIIPGLI